LQIVKIILSDGFPSIPNGYSQSAQNYSFLFPRNPNVALLIKTSNICLASLVNSY